jgi:hypothetical protein
MAAAAGGQATVDGLAPDPVGRELGTYLLNADEIHTAILSETAEAAERGRLTESGRTVCTAAAGYESRPPLARYDRAVSLAACPAGETGILHTHVTQQELARPTHSLPDLANVIFGRVAASVVVGTETSQLVMRPADTDQAVAAFRDALGVDVRSPRDVVGKLNTGQITDPPAARAAVRAALPQLFTEQPTPRPALRDRLRSEVIPLAASRATVDAPHGHVAAGLFDGGPDVAGVRRQSREVAAVIDRALAGVDVQQEVVSSALSTLAGVLVSEYLL